MSTITVFYRWGNCGLEKFRNFPQIIDMNVEELVSNPGSLPGAPIVLTTSHSWIGFETLSWTAVNVFFWRILSEGSVTSAGNGMGIFLLQTEAETNVFFVSN